MRTQLPMNSTTNASKPTFRFPYLFSLSVCIKVVVVEAVRGSGDVVWTELRFHGSQRKRKPIFGGTSHGLCVLFFRPEQ